MSHVNCPLCGRNQALSKFNPESLDDDIYVVSFRGLGRGRGFEKTGETSTMAPGDPVTDQVKDRCLAIIDFLLKSGCANTEEVYETLNIQNPQELKEDLDEYETVVKDLLESARKLFDEYTFETDVDEDPMGALREVLGVLDSEYESLEAKEEKVYAVIRELVDDVENALKGDYDFDFDPGEDSLESLKTCIQVLLDEYEATSADAEEEDEEDEEDEE